MVVLVLLIAAGSNARADLALETESARLLEPGHYEFGTAFEFQTSRNGEEYALPMAFEAGLYKHLELMIEPVPFTSIHPSKGKSATGIGDVEATVTYLVLEEKGALPAMGLAAEVKFPTARDFRIGSREFDYRLYFVASKRVGPVDLHFNIGYNIIGQPPGTTTQNPIDVEFAGEWFINDRFDLFAEVTYVGSSARAGEGDSAGATAAEVAGEEIVGSTGVRFHLSSRTDIFGSFSYDNKDAKLFRTGVTLHF
jgi:hypothetical protein